MAAAIAHRGPDDRGIEVIDSVGLVHTRLAIVDPTAAGHQPMVSHSGRTWVTYNGEIFNHLQLRDELPPVAWRGGSDTETLLHALETWGDAGIERCNGLFAYALLDPSDRRVLLVRDRFGVKPLYTARHAGGLLFASEMGALLAAGVPRRARPDVLRHATELGWANGPLTPIEGIDRVLPGTAVSVDLDTLEASVRRWYDPVETVDEERSEALSELARGDAVDAVESALRLSVRRRLMSDVPLGTMCSGGVDSSLVTAFARDELDVLHAFNASVVDQPEVDEGPWAERVARRLDVELHTVTMTAESWRGDLVDVVRHIEYPLTHESSVPMAQIADLAHSRGVKVLLSGEGADELFGGYGWLHGHAAADFRARGNLAERVARAALRGLQSRGLVRDDLTPEPRPGPSAEVSAYERGLVDRALRSYGHHGGPRRLLEAGLASDLGTYLPHLLNRQDKSTMRGSIETRVPFLDPDLVALALNLPLEVRAEPRTKGVLRDLADRHLPAGIADRPKVGFGFDVDRYILPAARPEFLADGRLREVLGVPAAEWRERSASAREYAALLLWTAEIWCRCVLDGEPVDAVNEALWRTA